MLSSPCLALGCSLARPSAAPLPASIGLKGAGRPGRALRLNYAVIRIVGLQGGWIFQVTGEHLWVCMLGNSGDKGCASCLEMPRRLQHLWAVDSQGGKASEEMEGTW